MKKLLRLLNGISNIGKLIISYILLAFAAIILLKISALSLGIFLVACALVSLLMFFV